MTQDPDAVETAWRIHAANADWTGKVDSKASFALAIESAIVAGVVALASDQRRLSELDGFWTRAFFTVGAVALIAALLCVVRVVRHRLRSKSVKGEAPENFIYFGHAQHWAADDLAAALKEYDMLEMLSRQIIDISRIAWMKHRMLQLSMTLTTTGVSLVGVAAWLNG